MKTVKLFLLVSCSLLAFSFNGNAQQRKVALLDLSTRNGETNTSRYRSCVWILNTAGIEYTSTTSLATALTYPVIFMSPVIKSTTFKSQERTSLTNYVKAGGIIICSSVQTSNFNSLCGVSAYESLDTRKYFNSNTSSLPWLFDRIDDSAETSIRFLGTTTGAVCTSRSYTLNGGTSLASYEDGKSAFVYRATGKGAVYTFGMDLRDVILRFQIDDDGNAQESYSNSFEPGSDVFMMLIQNIVRHHIPNTVRLHTSPRNSTSSVMVTHDYDSKSCQDTCGYFADMEYSRGIKAMYNITTSYYSNGWISGFYNTSYSSIQYLLSKGHLIASHSVGHFPDFETDSRFPLGTKGLTTTTYHPTYTAGVTTNGCTYGEVEVSKNLLETDHKVPIKSFRSGELNYNKTLAYALSQTGYKFNSSFSANDVLTNFPFYAVDGKKVSGAQLPILEISMTISDVWTPSMSASNYIPKVAIWNTITKKNDANNAPTVLLIHPNRRFKVLAEEMYLDSLPSSALLIPLDEYGEYWQERDTLDFYSTLSNNVLNVYLNTDNPDERISYVIDSASKLSEVHFYTPNGNELTLSNQSWANGATLYYTQKSNQYKTSGVVEKINNTAAVVYPNPSTSDVNINIEHAETGTYTLTVFDALGQQIIHTQQTHISSAGMLSFPWNVEKLTTGCYYFSINGGNLSSKGKIMVVH